MRHLIALALLTWPVLAAAQVHASRAFPSIPGDSMRVSLRNGPALEGRLQRWTADSVVLRRVVDSRATDTVMALSHVSTVEARVRRHAAGSAAKGFGLGVLAGGASGALLATLGMSSCAGEMCGLGYLTVPLFAAAGGVTGLLVGAVRSSEVWDVVWRSERGGS